VVSLDGEQSVCSVQTNCHSRTLPNLISLLEVQEGNMAAAHAANSTLLMMCELLCSIKLVTTQPPVRWVPCLSRGKGGRGVVLTTHPNLVYRGSRKRVELYLYLPKRHSQPLIRWNLTLKFVTISITGPNITELFVMDVSERECVQQQPGDVT
jgi:hypothetical protein